jgi:hypothetical protein
MVEHPGIPYSLYGIIAAKRAWKHWVEKHQQEEKLSASRLWGQKPPGDDCQNCWSGPDGASPR